MKRIVISCLSVMIFAIKTITVKEVRSDIEHTRIIKNKVPKQNRTRYIIRKDAPRFKSRQSYFTISTAK